LTEVVEVGGDLTTGSVTMGLMVCSETVSRNPLVRAVMNDDLDEVRARVMMRAKVNVRDKSYDGISPLHAAVENGNIEIAQFLLDSGAKANIRDFRKRTPLMMMDGDATPEIVDLLLRHGAKVQSVDKEKNTVLHHFVENADDQDMVRLLVAQGINVNAVNGDRETALMIASKNGNTDDVKALLESGADVGRSNADNKTAWDLADNDEIKSLLESYGAVARKVQ
jgi:ankyrin repeat protein